MNSLSWVEINNQAIQHNIKQFRKLLPHHFKIAAVIKSNAYSHGMIPVAQFLEKAKSVEYLATASDSEALALRQARVKLPILVLSFWDEKNLPALIKNKIELGIYSAKQLEAIARYCRDAINSVFTLKIHLKLDTGMHRLGFYPQEAESAARKLSHLSNITIQGIFSHFAAADENAEFSRQQLLQFQNIVAKIKRRIDIPLVHIANSAGVFSPDKSCNVLRLGIAMYGLAPTAALARKLNLKPALSWKTRIIQIKKVEKGERISYGLTYQFKQRAKIAILPIGYADGYDRKLSNCGEVLISGKRCPVRGRVCMNLTAVEVTRVPGVREGDEAVLIGKQGKNEITADELAQKIGTINYEIVTRINWQIERKIKVGE